MRITLQNDNGSVHFRAIESSDIRSRSLRSSKVSLINGGSYIHNAGMNITDNNFSITANLNINQLTSILSMADAAETITIFTRNGVYTGIINSITPNSWPVAIDLIIESEVVSSDDIIYPPAPTADWHEYTSDSYWQDDAFPGPTVADLTWGGGSWTGGYVTSGQNPSAYRLDAIGTWANGWKPTKFRITYTYSMPAFTKFEIFTLPDYKRLYNSVTIPTTETEYILDWDNPYQAGTHDTIETLIWYSGLTPHNMDITKIEFYGTTP